MFIKKSLLPQFINKKVKIIGRLSKIESPFLFINSFKNEEIKIKYLELHKYTDKTVIVTGIVQNNLVVNEENVDLVEDGFDLELFSDVLEMAGRFKEVFYEN